MATGSAIMLHNLNVLSKKSSTILEKMSCFPSDCTILKLHLAEESYTFSKNPTIDTDSVNMKGDKKRRLMGFKKGTKYPRLSENVTFADYSSDSGPCQVSYVRPVPDEMDVMRESHIVDHVLSAESDSAENSENTMLLRSQAAKEPEPDRKQAGSTSCRENIGCYKLMHTTKLWNMINCVTRQHTSLHPRCKGLLSFDNESEEQRGLVWRERVKCTNCQYRSDMYSLYEEVPSPTAGRRAATANIGINVALMQTPVAATSIRKILAGGNIPPPSECGMNKTTKKVGKVIIQANKEDMRDRRARLRKINTWKGRPKHVIAAQSDGVYNNNLYSGIGRTPFQPATQVTYTVAEHMTSKKQIVAVEPVNKLCPKYGFHTQNEQCTLKDCPSTASMETNIGNEERWADRCLRDLACDGLEVKYLTTDGDSKAFQAATNLHKQKVTQTAPVHQLDTRHLCENHRKKMKNNEHVKHMMPTKTVKERLKLRNRFSLDLSKR